jgi:hypothetical protein
MKESIIHLNVSEWRGALISLNLTNFQFGSLILASFGILSLSQNISSEGDPVNQKILNNYSTSDSPEKRGSP